MTIEDRMKDSEPFEVQCFSCKYYLKYNICIAFPEGIPDEILANDFDHKKPYFKNGKRGDNNILYEKA